jgi:hypothetical protein
VTVGNGRPLPVSQLAVNDGNQPAAALGVANVRTAAVAVVRALTATKRFRSKAEVDHDEFHGVKQAFDCEGLAVTMIEKDNHVRSA